MSTREVRYGQEGGLHRTDRGGKKRTVVEIVEPGRDHKVLDYAQKAGIPFVTTDTGEVKTEDDKKSFYREIQRIADYAKTKKITVCLEMHGTWCTIGRTGAEIITKVNHPNVRLNDDSGNVMLYGKVRPEENVKHALPYMAVMHLKDYTGPISVEIEFDGRERILDVINGAVKKSYSFLKARGLP